MHLAQLRQPLTRAAANSCHSVCRLPTTHSSVSATALLSEQFAHLRIGPTSSNVVVQGRRYASVKAQGAYKLTAKKTIPKKLGAKKTGDQYVIPGNIIYKQRGTLWHPGENTIMGRDHTIHAAVAGYVKYYRDPQRHPDRQYIGVVFNRSDKLPYRQDAPRKRKLGLVAVPRKVQEVEKPTMSASGLPLWVTRTESIEIPPPAVTTTTTPAAAGKAVKGKGARVTASGAAAVPATSSTISASSNNGGNSVIAELIKEKLAARAEYNARQSALRKLQQQKMLARRGTRVLRLMNNYSYRETNWEIGRLIGDPGSVPGTEKVGSRKAKFRARRRRRSTFLLGIKERKLAKADRREEYRRRVREKREQRLVQRKEFLAKQREAKKAKEGAAAEKAEKPAAEKKDVKAEKPAAPKVEEKKAEKPKAPEAKKESKPKVEEKKAAEEKKESKPKAPEGKKENKPKVEEKKAAEPKKDSKTEKKE
ncbi:ribosomal L27 protein-domain-containing protein [Pseudoneurospora amorphoporcata]|uniref:Large ribosomal subunit protein bL27m n=1 Tax=Pseudoneurospora amorphoporcata TaxID=241081 RepID=A0AAN6NPX6_9PEZI|nr:ribosomal L27 protein-domain-containing protein [Pseudoneurospora amorphoporcata]